MIPASTLNDPTRLGWIVYEAMEEIFGQNGVKAILDIAHLPYIEQIPANHRELKFPFTNLSQLQVTLEKTYGPQAGRGFAMRVGQACFKYLLREYGVELGLTQQSFRLLPGSVRMVQVNETLAGFFSQFTDQPIRFEMDGKKLRWHVKQCPQSSGQPVGGPGCALIVGFLQDTLYWVSGGKYYQVEEQKCIACGDGECTIVMEPIQMS